MKYKIEEDELVVEVREIPISCYFEFYNEVYQRVLVSSSFSSRFEIKGNEYPIYAFNLTTGVVEFFSSDGTTEVTPLYEKSSLVLTRHKQ
jgi:hypothetical protein